MESKNLLSALPRIQCIRWSGLAGSKPEQISVGEDNFQSKL
jgi:hypothetical protein